MVDRDSGIVAYDSPSSQRIEAFARIAYTIGQSSMRRPEGTCRLLERLLACSDTTHKNDCAEYRILLVDFGVAPGQAELEFTGAPSDMNSRCRMVRIFARQSDAQMSMACARAAAQFVAWVRGEEWGDRLIEAVALAIAMPEPAFRAEMDVLSIEDLADAYVVDAVAVTTRLGMFRTQHGSGERAAITSLA